MTDRLFYFSLISSLFVHSCILVYFSFFSSRHLAKPLKQLEVTYYSVKQISEKKQPQPAPKQSIKEQKINSKDVEILSKNTAESPVDFIKNMGKFMDKQKLQGDHSAKVRVLDTGGKISIPVFQSEKITNPKYLSYNDKVRQKIKERAYLYVNHPDFKEGEVYLTFILLADGSLKQVQIMDQKTMANAYLRNVGLKSIKESTPFPAFPTDLKYPELSFNVVISFEVNE